jgi:hypothetical protein
MNKKISCEIQKYFLPPIFAKNFLAAALLDIFQPWKKGTFRWLVKLVILL